MSKAADKPVDNKAAIKKLQGEIELYDMSIEDDPDSPDTANAYYMKAGVLVKMQKLTKEASYFNQALQCYNKAIDLSNSENPLYLSDRSKLYVEMGETEKAVADMTLVSKLPKQGGIAGIYVGNTIKDLQKLDSVQSTIQQLAKSGKIDGELAQALQEHAKVTAGLVVQVGAHGEKLDKHDTDIAQLFSLVEAISQGNQLSAEQIAKIKSDFNKSKKQLDDNTAKITGQEIAMKAAGVYDKAEVKQAFDKLAKESAAEYAYLKTFYWTSVNLFGAYRSLSTGLIKGDLDSQTDTKEGLLVTGAKKLAGYGADIAQGIPIVGSIIGVLDSVIDDVYEVVKSNRLENKVNSINKIIEAKFGLEEDISINLAKLALSMVQTRKQEILHPKAEEAGIIKISIEWLQKKFETIKDKIMPSVDLHDQDNASVQLALKDVTLLMVYLCKNHEAIIKTTLSLDQQINVSIERGELDNLLIDRVKAESAGSASTSGGHMVASSSSSSSSSASSSSSYTVAGASAAAAAVHPGASASTAEAHNLSAADKASKLQHFSKIEQTIGQEDLNMIHKKAAEAHWGKGAFSVGMNVSEFLEESYIKSLFGKSTSAQDIEDTSITIFKHICLGISQSKTADSKCAVRFAEKYPTIFTKIANNYPEFFVDTKIATDSINNHVLRNKVLSALINQEQTTKAYALTDIIYDNELLNHPKLISGAIKLFGLDKALDLSQGLSQELVSEAIDNEDMELVLSGMVSLDANY